MSKKVIITGATGFIGRNLTNSLISQKHDVLALSSSSFSSYSEEQSKKENIYSTEQLSLVMDEFIDGNDFVLVHTATKFLRGHSFSEINQIIEANVTYGTQILDLCSKNRMTKFINLNSFWQYLDGNPNNPFGLYASSKEAFKSIIKGYSNENEFKVFNLVLFDTFGPEDTRDKLLNILLKKGEDSSAIKMSSGNQLLNYTYIEDVVKAITLVISSDTLEGSEYEISHDNSYILREVVQIVEKELEVRINVDWNSLEDRKTEMYSKWGTAPRLPGWNPSVSLQEGIRSIINKG